MRPAVVRLIANKEFRDLLRDRRTVLLILVLPALLYPLFGGAGLLFAFSLTSKPIKVGVLNPPPPGAAVPLLDGDHFAAPAADEPEQSPESLAQVVVTTLPADADPDAELRAKHADAVLVVPPGLEAELKAGRKPTLRILTREGDERSKLAVKRLTRLVRAWEGRLREKRFAERGLPKDFDEVITLEDPRTDKPKGKRAADELRDTFARVFPFVLIMWLVAGAIQPAVDMTAGEKERGTMETLLISPAERAEVVAGKFLAVTLFSFASVVWNVVWLAGGGFLVAFLLGSPILNPVGVLACVVLALPLAMLFSAVCLALGVFAKSTKEGQYYLMPLILVVMPLAFWGMLPGTELTPLTAIIPVTGPMLLQGRMLAVSGEGVPGWYFLPVLGSSAVWVTLALLLAVRQFKSEAVLFRESGPTRRKGGWRWRKPVAP